MKHHPKTKRRQRVSSKAAYSAMIREARVVARRFMREFSEEVEKLKS